LGESLIKCILFDMGGVILTQKIENILMEIAKKLKIPFQALVDLRAEHKVDMWDGKMGVKDFALIIKQKFFLSMSVNQILRVWEKTYLGMNHPNEECLGFARELMKQYKVGMISNLWDFHVKINRKRGLYDGFDPLILSPEVHMHKPQREIFELAVKQAGVDGCECVFIDDRSEYFVVAESLGMKTIEFKSFNQLKTDLEELGVVVK
jgi:HAD superfamily hydrolase (TIGR01509 family)